MTTRKYFQSKEEESMYRSRKDGTIEKWNLGCWCRVLATCLVCLAVTLKLNVGSVKLKTNSLPFPCWDGEESLIEERFRTKLAANWYCQMAEQWKYLAVKPTLCLGKGWTCIPAADLSGLPPDTVSWLLSAICLSDSQSDSQLISRSSPRVRIYLAEPACSPAV